MYEYYISYVYGQRNGGHGFAARGVCVKDKIDNLDSIRKLQKRVSKEENGRDIVILSFQLLKRKSELIEGA